MDEISEDVELGVQLALREIAKPLLAAVHVERQDEGRYLWSKIEVTHYGAERAEMQLLFDQAVDVLRTALPPIEGRERWGLAVHLRGEPIDGAFG